jgi:hypothetical protein
VGWQAERARLDNRRILHLHKSTLPEAR